MVNIKSATLEDIFKFAEKLREEDIEECQYLLGMSGIDALLYSYKGSKECYIVEIDGVASCLYGCCSLNEGALFWILISKEVTRLPKTFFSLAKLEINNMLTRYKFLENHGESTKSFIVKFGKWLGFTVSEPQPYGKGDKLYCKFRIERSVPECV